MRSLAKAPWAQIALLLIFYVIVWTLYATWTQRNLDGFGDMLENYSWGIAWQNGYFKHPPLFAWITAAWFSVLPRADWAYYLLSAVNSAVMFFFSWRIAVRFLDPWRAVLSTALFFFLPPVTFLAIKYNANAAMLPFWAGTALFYLRFLEKRRLVDAVILGALAAGAVLIKYYSAALLGAICLHVLLDRQARPLLASLGVWLASATFLILIAPHVYWLFQNDFRPLTYAAEQGDGSALAGVVSAPRFLGALLAYLLPVLLVLLIAILRNGRGAWFETRRFAALRTSLVGRALLWTNFGALALTLLLGVAFAVEFSSVWALPLYFAAPILLLLFVRPGRLEEQRLAIPAAVVIYGAALLALSPIIRSEEAEDMSHYNAVPVRSIATQIEKAWNERFDAPFVYVAGDKILASGTTFYAASRPYSMQESSFQLTPWITEADVRARGIAIACFADQAWCIGRAEKFPVGAVAEEEFTVPGFNGERDWQVRLFLVPPA
ncbi:glycosyltransferase family 39 protein [Nitratireductor sp. ZSWI3]|uniref:glycosyltransferase family 39 protein n=1 Tax=Nitratireductor sp. ZSWI3 TaxID=2966359 RepID=UPI00214F99E9|nr:glycosyltransferase family 39 protein [Nitratireductor sp. ZSWI3]MCR4268975.1 glycosyltransferase family 39 protein [Nitratireductor sp. ZSWI3]